MIRFFADYTLLIVLVLGAVVLLFDGVRHKAAVHYPLLIMAGLTSLLVGKLMSIAYQPSDERPFIAQGVAPGAAYIDNPGFPSDHALLAVATVLGVYMLTRRKLLTVFLCCVVAAMLIARVLALVHTPLDIIGGVGAGLVGGLWYVGMKTKRT